MSLVKNRWFRRVGFAAVAALSLGTAAMASSPAEAHDFGHHRPVAAHHMSRVVRHVFGFGHHWHPVYRHWR